MKTTTTQPYAILMQKESKTETASLDFKISFSSQSSSSPFFLLLLINIWPAFFSNFFHFVLVGEIIS